jgi:hypothetical protein
MGGRRRGRIAELLGAGAEPRLIRELGACYHVRVAA